MMLLQKMGQQSIWVANEKKNSNIIAIHCFLYYMAMFAKPNSRKTTVVSDKVMKRVSSALKIFF